MAEERLIDVVLGKTKPEEQKNTKNILWRPSPTLHRRDVEHSDFFVAARFIHALVKVKAAVEVRDRHGTPVKVRLPLVADMGEQVLNLPVWRKTGLIWEQAGYKCFEKEALAVAVPMMHAIVRYLGIRENAILNALFKLSMISVDMLTGTDGKRSFRQRLRGNLINPCDGQPLNIKPEFITGIDAMSAFILDKNRVNEWIQKDIKKRGDSGN